MKTKRTSTRLTAAAVEAFREEKHRDRVALADRVRRGELTAREANNEASIFRGQFDPIHAVIDWKATFASLRRLSLHERSHRNAKKAVHA
jgi:hypothetical protein